MDRLDDLVRELRSGVSTPAPDFEHAAEPPPAVAPTRRRRAHLPAIPRRSWRRLLMIAGGVLAVVLGVAAILPKGAPDASGTVVMPAATPTPADTTTAFAVTPSPLQWKGIVEQLDRTRGLAFMHAQPTELLTVYANDSPARSTDMTMAQALKNSGAHAGSFPLRVLSVEEQYLTVGERTPRAMLTVVDVMGAYDILDTQGRVLRHVPARGERTWNVELERSSVWGWVFVSAVSAASP